MREVGSPFNIQIEKVWSWFNIRKFILLLQTFSILEKAPVNHREKKSDK